MTVYSKKGKYLNPESGRSMIEMIGVLAIIGILSVVGIMGYQYALDAYKASRLIDDLNQRALIYSAQLISTHKLTESEFPPKTSGGYSVSTLVRQNNGKNYMQMAVEQVEGGVCRQILKADWKWVVLKKANGIEFSGDTSICRSDSNVRMVFLFSEDLTETEVEFRIPCEKDSDCKNSCGLCSNGYCVSQCPDKATCSKSYDNFKFDMCCLNDHILNGMCCSSIQNGMCCSGEGDCCPADKPLMDNKGNCHSCHEEDPINVSGNTVMCNICDGKEGRLNRVLNGSYCALPCPEEKPLMDSAGQCHTCDEHRHIGTVNAQTCMNICDGSDDTIHMKRSEWFGPYGLCFYPCAENEVTATIGREPCRSCTDPTSIYITFKSDQECITHCDGSAPDRPKRKRLGYSNGHSVCMLVDCPADRPIKDSGGTCRVCTDTWIGISDESECFKCPNKALRGNICIPDDRCPARTHVDPETKKCVCDDPTDIQSNDGNCYPCDDPVFRIDITGRSEECNRCSKDRILKRFYPGIESCVRICEDNEFYTGSGCKRCDDTKPYSLYAQTEHCLHCDGQNGREKRVCLLPWTCHVCALPCPEGTVMAGDGTCHTCDEVEAFGVGLGVSSSCTQGCVGRRYLIGSTCYKCPEDTYSPDSKECVVCPLKKETLTRMGDCVACGGKWEDDSCHPIQEEAPLSQEGKESGQDNI